MENTQQNEQEAKTNTISQHRIIFYALLEAAMRHREGFWREDIESHRSSLMEANKGKLVISTFAQRNKINNWIKNKVLELQQHSEKLNAMIYGAIESLNKSFSPPAQKAFDNYSTAYSLIADSLAKAKNTTELLTICQLYTDGKLDYIFEELKNSEFKNQINNQYENKDNSIVSDGDHLRVPTNELQEEQPNTAEYGTYDKPTSDPTIEH